MGRSPLLLALESMEMERNRFTPEAVLLDLVSIEAFAHCPECGQRFSRIHSRYCRELRPIRRSPSKMCTP
jgi:hypothetical protein